MKVLIQAGHLGKSVRDHHISPIAHADDVQEIFLVCRHPNWSIPKVRNYSPPQFVTKFAPAAVLCEFFILLYLALFKKPSCIIGFLLFPHCIIAFTVAKLTGRPIISSLIAGQFELYVIGGGLGAKYDKPIRWPYTLLLKILKHSDAVVTQGSVTRNFLIKQGVEADKISPIINSANKSRFYPIKLEKRYDMLYVGRLSPEKHVDVFLRVVAEVKQRRRSIRACVLGDGPQRQLLTRLASELGISENIEFAGFQEDVARYYNMSKVLVLTSEREGFPNVFLEAMLCGVPSVVSDCGDIVDVAKDGFNCMVIPKYDDHKAYADAACRILGDEELYAMLSRNAIESMKGLSEERVTSAWKALFNRITCKEKAC